MFLMMRKGPTGLAKNGFDEDPRQVEVSPHVGQEGRLCIEDLIASCTDRFAAFSLYVRIRVEFRVKHHFCLVVIVVDEMGFLALEVRVEVHEHVPHLLSEEDLRPIKLSPLTVWSCDGTRANEERSDGEDITNVAIAPP